MAAGAARRVIRDATTKMKHVLGRSAYVWAAAKNLRTKPFQGQIEVDGSDWYEGQASLVLFGNVGEAFAGVKAFEDAQPDDGLLEIGVGSADGILQWSRMLARSATRHASKSPFVHVTKGRTVKVKLSRRILYELDGGDREKKKTFCVDVQPNAVSVCVPAGRRLIAEH